MKSTCLACKTYQYPALDKGFHESLAEVECEAHLIMWEYEDQSFESSSETLIKLKMKACLEKPQEERCLKVEIDS